MLSEELELEEAELCEEDEDSLLLSLSDVLEALEEELLEELVEEEVDSLLLSLPEEDEDVLLELELLLDELPLTVKVRVLLTTAQSL